MRPHPPAIELFDPMRPEILRDPFEAYRALRDHDPVADLAPLDLWAVSRYEHVRQVLDAPEAFSAARAFGKTSVITDPRRVPELRLPLRFAAESGAVVSASDGAQHVRLRRLVAILMTKQRLDQAEAAVREQVELVVAALAQGGGRFDVLTDLARPVAVRAIGSIMGLSPTAAEALARWVDLTFRALDPGDLLSGPDGGTRLMRSNLAAFRSVAKFLESGRVPDGANGSGGQAGAGIGAHAAPELDGLAGAWLQDTEPSAREEVILSVLHLFQAGYETIVSAICYFVAEMLADRPDGPAPLRAVPPQELSALLPGLVDEGLRLASPVRATVRTTVGEQEIGGVPVPDGALLLVLLGSANRDERVFPDPDLLRPGRPGAHLAFGAGPHRCLGRVLAHLELRLVIDALLSSTRSLRILPSARVCANILKAGYDSLPAEADWREPESRSS